MHRTNRDARTGLLSPSRLPVLLSVAALIALAALIRADTDAPAPEPLKLNQGDHIAIIGNTLADRMQHDSYLETLIVASNPKSDLVFRNLAVAGDEVVTRARSENFGSPDDWLTRAKANIIFAFFGFNESFKGEAGLGAFKNDLTKFLHDTKSKNYSGQGAPRVVLFSPIANERHQDHDFPDPAANNKNIALYTAAMAEVAKANGMLFVDLYTASQKLYADASAQNRSLTINGLHLSAEGDKLLANVILPVAFNQAPPAGDTEKLRAAIIDKNDMWHSRYRTVDGYNVYGGRSQLKFPDGPGKPDITNYKVMQEEMNQRDVLTANRDKHVWAVASGQDTPIDDSNLPAVEPVVTNHPGPHPDGTWDFLSGEQAISKMTVPDHVKVNLFASEEQFPELVKPVQAAWDTKGRLWVSVWPSYPERTPTSTTGDSILIFEDTKGTGKADKCTHFIDNLNCPTGFQFYKDGILLMQAPDLWYVHSTDGSGKGNAIERVLMGMDSADSHHTTNSMVLEPGGAVYLSDGVFHRTQVETPDGPVRNEDACIYRFEPNTGRFERYAPYGFANPHGRVFDYWGNDIITDATGNNSYFGPAISGHLNYPDKHPGIKDFWNRPSRPCPGTAIMTSSAFPPEYQGNFLNCNAISFQGIYRVKMTEDGSGLGGVTQENLISSSDPNFRPTGVSVGPDGAIYVLDWQNPIIGHMQHNIRDPNRDHKHGRIYRLTYEGLPLAKFPKIDGQPIPVLLDLLKSPENQIRMLAKIELGKHESAEVLAATKKWADALDKNDPGYEHNLMEALWVFQWHNTVDHDLLVRMLRSPDYHARAAATRVLCYQRDDISDALPLLKVQATDEHPRVRLEAIRAASFFTGTEAVHVALAAQKLPTDFYIDYVLRETLRPLHQWVDQAASENSDEMQYVIRTAKTADLLKLPPGEAVEKAIVARSDATDSMRNDALIALAKQQNTTSAGALISLINSLGKTDPTAIYHLLRLLPIQPADDLKAKKQELTSLTTSGGSSEVRGVAWGSLAMADNSFDTVWNQAAKSTPALTDLLTGIPLISDLSFRGKAYDHVKPLLSEFPADLKSSLQPEPSDSQQETIRRAAIRAAASMGRERKATFVALASLIQKNQLISSSVAGIRALPVAAWDKSQLQPTVKALLAWGKSVPVAARDQQDYVESIQLASEMAAQLPPDQAAMLQHELKELRVAVFVVKTVSEQMRFDTPRLVVQTAKPFEVIFENADNLPHNFVVVTPGSRPRVGKASAEMKPTDIDNQGRQYIPMSRQGSPAKEILGGTKLLDPGHSETLKLSAPTKPGSYEFLCTYPGHWEMMWGQLIVTPDVDTYLQAHPQATPVDMPPMHH